MDLCVKYAVSAKSGRPYLAIGVDLGYAFRILTVDRGLILELCNCLPSMYNALVNFVSCSEPKSDGSYVVKLVDIRGQKLA